MSAPDLLGRCHLGLTLEKVAPLVTKRSLAIPGFGDDDEALVVEPEQVERSERLVPVVELGAVSQEGE